MEIGTFSKIWGTIATDATVRNYSDRNAAMRLMLKELRRAAGFSQQELADKLRIPCRTYGAWERGESAINLKQAAAICNALHCTPNDLVGWPESGLTQDEHVLLNDYRECDSATQRSIATIAGNGAVAAASQAQAVHRGRRAV